MDQDEETCADLDPQRHPNKSSKPPGPTSNVPTSREGVRRKRARPQEVIANQETAEELEVAITRSYAKISQMQTDTERVQRLADQLSMKLLAAR